MTTVVANILTTTFKNFVVVNILFASGFLQQRVVKNIIFATTIQLFTVIIIIVNKLFVVVI